MFLFVCVVSTLVALLIAWEKLKDPGNGSKMHVLVSKIGGSTLVYMYARYDFLDAAQKVLYMLESEMLCHGLHRPQHTLERHDCSEERSGCLLIHVIMHVLI